jgi:hypothetical protein
LSRHPDLRPLLDDLAGAGPERAALLEHLRRCASCRAAVASDDPSRLFALLATEAPPPEVLDRLSHRVAAAVAAAPSRRPGRPAWAYGAIAASIVAAGVFGAYLWESGSSGAPDPAPPRRVAREVRPPAPISDRPAGMIEVLDSPGEADVVEMAVGDVQVVMIFDREFPL